MNQMEIAVQIFTGGYGENKIKYETIEKKLIKMFRMMPVKKVILGWSVNQELYKRLNDFLHRNGVESYLWLPVFSENGLLRPTDFLVDDLGQKVTSFRAKEGENFEFYCPNDSYNVRSFLEIYETYYDNLDFDGVFLDKIRYSTFSNGLSGVFNCFCSHCMEKYKAAGIDVDVLKEEMRKARAHEAGYDKTPLKITGYQNGKYTFEEKIWERFFQMKADSVSAAMQEITDFFRKKDRKIGLDLLSPFVAYFAGQDFERLGGMVDYIKPMMYRITNASAGLPFEYANFMKETIGEKEEKEFSMDFVESELAVAKKAPCAVYSGIDVNRIKGVVNADPKYITQTLDNMDQQGLQGLILSWDMLCAPDRNLKAIGNYLRKKGVAR